MAKVAALSLFFLLLSLISGGTLVMVNGEKTWCVAKPSSDQATLLANINFACSQVDCRVMQRGCPCFSPDNLIPCFHCHESLPPSQGKKHVEL